MFIEFDDFGEPWQRNPSGRPSQLQHAIGLIRLAKQQDPTGSPLILAFVHGWKHNASIGKKSGGDDSNIIGFATVLNQLHQSQPNKVILGIYFAWRGGLISPYWPVSQQLTYWNREATAMRVGNTSLTDALIEISDTVHEQQTASQGQPVLVYVGHSFGALALERALSQATVTRMEKEWEENSQQASNAAVPPKMVSVVPLANLVIYVNSAAAATEAKQLMDYLASSQYFYRPNGQRDEPLFLSVTSESDLATGFAQKIGHAIPLATFKINGSMRDKPVRPINKGSSAQYSHTSFAPPPIDRPESMDPSTLRFDLSESDYYMSTAAHLRALWSHQVVASQTKSPYSHPYCSLNAETSGPYMTCHIGSFDYEVAPVSNRCNGTPYWIIEVPKEIIPDHTTIFTGRLIVFLTPFITATEKQPTLSRPLAAQ